MAGHSARSPIAVASAIGLAIGMMLAGCADRPSGTLIPIAAGVPGTARVDMLVATTRASSPERGVLFSGGRGTQLSVENIVVSVPPDRAPGTLTYPGDPVDPRTQFTVRSIEPTEGSFSDQWFRRVAGREGGDVLIFVHGFNTTYEESVFRFAQIVHDTGARVAPILFTWPSQGSIFDYLYDRESANFSRSALEAMIKRSTDDPRVRSVTVMAHSMGGWLTMEALRQLAIRERGLPAKIRNVVLASPDVDIDVFGRQLDDIGQSPGRGSARAQARFTVFASADDRALQVSRDRKSVV